MQKSAVKDMGAVLVPWIQIGRLGSTHNGLTRGCGLTGRLGLAVAVGSGSNDPGDAQAGNGARRPAASAARRRAAASGGARRKRHRSEPSSTGSTRIRRARAREPTGDLHGRRRSRTTAPGEARRRHTTGDGEDDGAAHEHPNQMHRGVPHQAAKLRDGSNRPGRRRAGGNRATADRGGGG
jgi:hypothetical protein